MRTLSTEETNKVASGGYAPVLRVSVEDSGGTFRDVDSYFGAQPFLVGVSLQEDVDGQGATATITLRREFFFHSLSPLMLSSGTARGYVPSASPSVPVALYRRVKVEWFIAANDEQPSSPTFSELFVGRIDRIAIADGENIRLECRDANVATLSDSFFERERWYGLTPAAYAYQKGCLLWAPSEAQAVGDLVVPSTLNGYLYRCTTAGTTGTTEPSWPTTVGNTVSDGTAVWTCGSATAAAGTVTMETVLQQMLNDSPVTLTLYAPDASSFIMNAWRQEREPILESLRKVAQLIGWDVRPRYDAAGTYRFQLYKPDRAASSPARTFSPSSYVDVGSLDMGVENIRNVVKVVYSDSADLGTDGKTPRRKYVTATDSASVTAYGRRYMELAEEGTSQVDTTAEANALAAAALADLATPLAELQVEALFFPWTQLGDLYRFSANNIHFDTDQDLAVVGYSHEAQLGDDGEQTFRTSLTCRGKPAGGRDRWLQWDSRPGVAPTHALQDSSGGVTLTVIDASEVPGGARFRIQEKLSRLAKWDGLELHISTTNNFTPSSTTLAAFSKADTVEVGNLQPGTTYYAKVIPRQINAGRIVLGLPSAQVSFSPGYVTTGKIASGAVSPAKLASGVDFGAVPLNGDFVSWTAGSGSPPDGWTLNSGTWNTDIGRSGTSSYFLSCPHTATLGTIISPYLRVQGDTLQVRVYGNGGTTLSGGTSDYGVRVDWYDNSLALLSSSTFKVGIIPTSFVLSPNVDTWVTPPAGVAFAKVVVGRLSSSTTLAGSLYLVSIRPASTIVDGSVTSAKLDTNIAVSGTLNAGGGTPLGILSALRAASSAGWAVSGKTSGVANESGVYVDASNNMELAARNGSGTLAVRIGSTGVSYVNNGANFGIGTTGPGNALTVARAASTACYVQTLSGTNSSLFGNGAGGETVLGSFSSQPVIIYTNSGERIRIDVNGNVGVGVSPVAGNSKIQSAGDITMTSGLGLLGNLYFDTAYKFIANGYGVSVSLASGEFSVGTTANNAGGAGASATVTTRLKVQNAGHLVPGADNALTLGASGLRWSQLWAGTTTINTSDERQKTDIAESDLGLEFIEALRPVRYRFKVGQNAYQQVPDGENEDGSPRFREELVPVPGKRPHYGFLAQHVAAVLGSKDFAGYVHDAETDVYGLRYSEFIAPLVKAVQELSARVRELEKKLADKESP